MTSYIFGEPTDKVLEAIKLYRYLQDNGMLEKVMLEINIERSKQRIAKELENLNNLERQFKNF